MIIINNLIKQYNKNKVLDVSYIEIKKSGLYIFSGINGSGKSTLLKLLSKNIFKTSGNIDLTGSISYLPDKFSLPPLINVNTYLKHISSLYQIDSSYKDLVSAFELPNKKISSLSKGNLQKLGIIQALINPTDIYIFDEPLDGLDEGSKKLFKQLIKQKIEDGKIIIMSLHVKTLFNDLKPILYNVKDGNIYEKKK